MAGQRAANFPWTFWPQCFSNENTKEPYCVFTSHDFAGGRGISIVTTSSDAYNILRKPAFSQPEILEYVNDLSNPPYVQHEFPIKGRGLVANKTLHRGDEIFSSTPLLINNPDAYDLDEAERLQLAHTAIAQLPTKTRELFWALLDHFKGDPVDDRINTNAFELEIFGNMRHGVFPEIAMLNHDCRPNAAYFFDEETLTHYVHATQDIAPGQEITITYTNNAAVRSVRMENLKRNWGFDCSCSSCRAHPALTAESDARLLQIEELEGTLDDWSTESTATPEMAEALISLMVQERLYASLGTAYRLAAMAYSSFGDKWNAVRYARLSVEYLALDKGFREGDVYAMKQLATDPEMQWSWRKRVGNQRFVGGCGHRH
ncbi:SET domain-containing protein [Lindgomyces ingoldianus]|uniref:SET domain-containing protein n=1 Tax=Lindgomyces ingoldianus TaxID=673940 RepID=A0ACB6QA17_9PLEO|nr:SET domain-containing protein [Lindgomyces ingoldianus]KAF2463798.1 SET domain-containing protein [Lindgomyces ingoldianus]